MTEVRRAPPITSDPHSPEKMGDRAAQARAVVAEQLAEMVAEGEISGSRDLLVQRVREVAIAAGENDSTLLRGALVELIGSAAAWVVAIDLRPGNPW